MILLVAGGFLLSACGAEVEPTITQGSPANTLAPENTSVRGSLSTPESTGVSGPLSTAVSISGDASDETIIIGISLYVLVDEAEPSNQSLSSRRTEDELLEILDGMNDIWRQADIELELRTVATVPVPANVLEGFLAGSLGPFFNGFDRTFNIPGTATINGFYVRSLGRANGVTVPSTRSFFVMDTPSVFDRRVSSHEVGHILGLEHTLSDQGRLLYPGTNGMILTSQEVEIARENASKLTGMGQ